MAKARQNCWTCKERKVGCDKTLPTCANCSRTNRRCQGYGVRLSWPDKIDGRRRQKNYRVDAIARSTNYATSNGELVFLNTDVHDFDEIEMVGEQLLRVALPVPGPSRPIPRLLITGAADQGGELLTYWNIVLSRMITTRDAELIYQATHSRAAVVVLTVLLAICFVNGTMGCATSASRLLYAMARDKGMIFPSVFGGIHKTLDVPVAAVLLVYVFNPCFGLLYLGPSVAFSAYAASCTIFINLSCAIPVLVLLIRGRGVLLAHQRADTPFKLGRWGYLCNSVAVVFVSVTTVFLCFPGTLPVGTGTMNYVSAVIGILVVLVAAYWWIYGNRFEDPELDVILGIAQGEGEVVELTAVEKRDI